MLATLVTAANMHDTQPVGALLNRAIHGVWSVERVKVDGIYVGPRMAQAVQEHGVDVQVTTRDADVKGSKPLPLRWRIEATFGTLLWGIGRRERMRSPCAMRDRLSTISKVRYSLAAAGWCRLCKREPLTA